MRLPFLAAAGLLAASLAAHADTYTEFTITGSTNILIPDGLGDIVQTIQDPISGSALFDEDTGIFTRFLWFSDYTGHVDDSGTGYYSDEDGLPCPNLEVGYHCRSINQYGFVFFDYNGKVWGPYGGYDRIWMEFDGSFTDPTPASLTPEPSTFALLGTGLFGVAGLMRRKLGKRTLQGS